MFSIGYSWLMEPLSVFVSGKGEKSVLVCGELNAENGDVGDMITAFYSRGFSLPDVKIFFLPTPNPDGRKLRLSGAENNPFFARNSRFAPDGDFSGLTANSRGVDIDANFEVGWREEKKSELEKGKVGPSLSGFCGEWPESEKETAALCKFCRKERPNAALLLKKARNSYFSVSGFSEKLVRSFCGYTNIPVRAPSNGNGSFARWLSAETGTAVMELFLSDMSSLKALCAALTFISATIAKKGEIC